MSAGQMLPVNESPTLRKVRKGDLCSGCGLCAGLAPNSITMSLDPEGFLRPVQKDEVTSPQEDRIAASCPGKRVMPWAVEAAAHPSWGPIRSCLTGYSTDDEIRHRGSSGGLLSALAVAALEAGLVDAVVHTAACDENPTRNRTRISTTREEVLAAAGSRYGPASPLDGLGGLIKSGLRYLFIGKPCDVSALNCIAEIDPEADAAFPFRLSFFCGGTPSTKGTDRILSELDFRDAALSEFRYRGNGWPGQTTAVRTDGTTASMSYERSWGEFLSKYVQYRCKICPDAVGGSADVAAADAWYGGESGYPQFEERDGRSLVLVRSEAGQMLLATAMRLGLVTTEPLAVSEIDLMQPAQARRKRLVYSRRAAARTLLQPMPEMTGTMVEEAARTARASESLRSYFGSLKRIITGQR